MVTRTRDFNHSDYDTMTYYKWIDVGKGIGILCVVVGHAITYLNHENATFIVSTIRNLIYSFHMPLFFFYRVFY
jgi:fucose 4-O-acetylase-like acetyltransferase